MGDITARLEDNVLDKLICDNCQCLLSVPPILLTEYGNICGRCKIFLPLWFTHNVLYETLASTFMFLCRYVKAGCNVKETFYNMRIHEAKCQFQTVTCSVDNCTWSGIMDTLILHICNSCTTHVNALIDMDDTNLLNEGKSLYVLVTVGHFFLIEWTLLGKKLEFQVINLNRFDTKTVFVFDVCFYKSGNLEKPITTVNKVELLTKQEIVFNFERGSDGLFVSFSINKKEFITINNYFLNYLTNILCSKCHEQIPPPILKCQFGHLFCMKCTKYFKNNCQLCNDETITTYTYASDLDGITLLHQYKCSQCSEFCNVSNIFEHKLNCPKRIHKCPSCNGQWTGLLNKYIEHARTCRAHVPHTFILGEELTTTSYETREYRVVAHKNLFTVIFVAGDDGMHIIITTYEDLFFGWFCFEATLYHAINPQSEFRKKFYCTNRSNNAYIINIPLTDMNLFHELHPFKITLRIILLSKLLRRINYYGYIKYDLNLLRFA